MTWGLVASVLARAACAAVVGRLAARDRDAGLALVAILLAGTAIPPARALADLVAGLTAPHPADAALGLGWSVLAAIATGWVVARRRRGRRDDDALRGSESFHRRVTAHLPDYLVVSDPDGTIRWVNRTLPELSAEAVLGRNVVEFVAPAHRERVETAFARAWTERRQTRYQVEFVAGEGVRWFETRVAPIVVDGEVRSILATSSDVTERVRRDATLARSRRLDSLATLSAGVAHEFNDLVTAIQGSAELARSDLGMIEDRAVRERLDTAVERVETAAARAARLTRQLLAFARRAPGRDRRVDVDGTIEDLADLLRGLLGEGTKLDLRLGSGALQVRIDPDHFEQIVVQLVANARDAVGTGGHVTIETLPVKLDREYARHNPEARPGPKLVLRVSDDGVGMDRATRARLFDPFFTTREPAGGGGLGLATVHGLVTVAGGHVEVDSDPGAGSTFRVFLPAAAEDASGPTAGRHEEPAAPPTPGTVLVCEDDPLVREVTVAALAADGHRVLEAAHAEGAIAIARDHDGPIDLLITDVVLPGIDGRELAERLTLHRPDVPVLFVSGHEPAQVRLEDVRVEVFDFLPKPYTPATLLPRVRALLARG